MRFAVLICLATTTKETSQWTFAGPTTSASRFNATRFNSTMTERTFEQTLVGPTLFAYRLKRKTA